MYNNAYLFCQVQYPDNKFSHFYTDYPTVLSLNCSVFRNAAARVLYLRWPTSAMAKLIFSMTKFFLIHDKINFFHDKIPFYS